VPVYNHVIHGPYTSFNIPLPLLLQPTNGGLVLINNRGVLGAAMGAPTDVPIQYLTVGTSVPVMGMQACALPASQQEHVGSPDDTSVQLVNTATVDNAAGTVAIYEFNWQGALPQSFGTPNAGQSEWGAFGEDGVPGDLPGIAGGNPAVLPPANPGGGGEAGGTCMLGPMSAWSPCSVTCTNNANAVPATGIQTQYRPVLAPVASKASGCAPLLDRSAIRVCTAANVCDACNNGKQDGKEQDIDCGGGLDDADFALLPDAAPAVSGGGILTPESANIIVGMIGEQEAMASAATGTCKRCEAGRQCTAHADCSWATGTVCLMGRCISSAVVEKSAAWIVRFTVTLAGVDQSTFVGPALTSYRQAIAEASTGNGVIVALKAVTISSVTARPLGQPPNTRTFDPVVMEQTARRLRKAAGENGPSDVIPQGAVWVQRTLQHAGTSPFNLRSILRAYSQRKLVVQEDELDVHTVILVGSKADANVIAGNLKANWGTVLLGIQERMRINAPLVGSIKVMDPIVVPNPWNNSTGVDDPNGGGGDPPGNNITGGTDGGASGLAAGVIAAIAIGAAAGIVVVVAGAVVLSRKVREARDRQAAEAAERERRRRAQARAIDIGETDGGAQATALQGGIDIQHGKASFKPQRANDANVVVHANGPVNGAMAGASALSHDAPNGLPNGAPSSAGRKSQGRAESAGAIGPEIRRRTPKGSIGSGNHLGGENTNNDSV
jgi:hypothetical protein